MRTDALTDLTILTAYANGGGAARRLIDMYLRRLGTPDQVGNAEGAALDADYRTAVSLAEGGRADSACALLRDASEGTKNPELAHRAHEMLRSFQANVKADSDITLYNRATDLANAGEYDSAAVTFDAVARAAQDMGLRQQATDAAHHVRLTGRYREALRLTANERYQEATIILRRLLASDPPDELAENARAALAEVDRLARGNP
jgi:tetratricopeptide (TPR) repeat protein